MRCKNCGWNNPENAKECEKCHAKFKNVPNVKGPGNFRPGTDKAMGRTPTVMGSSGIFNMPTPPPPPLPPTPPPAPSFGGRPSSSDSLSCTSCGYPLSEGVSSCPNCGSPVTAPAQSASPVAETVAEMPVHQGTILSGSSNFFSDVNGPSFVPVDGGASVPLPDSDSVSLNTNAGQLTTGAGMNVAELKRDGGNWSIEANDGEKEVYIRVRCGNFPLVDGDNWSIEANDGEKEVYIRIICGNFPLVDGDIIMIDGKQYRFTV